MLAGRDARPRSGKRTSWVSSLVCFRKSQSFLGILLVGLGLWGIYGSTHRRSPPSPTAVGLGKAISYQKSKSDSSAQPCDQLASVQRLMDDEGGQCKPLPPGEPHVGWLFRGVREAAPHALTTLAWVNDDKCLHLLSDKSSYAGAQGVSIWDCSGGRMPNEMWTVKEGVPSPITAQDTSGRTWCLTARSPQQGGQQPVELHVSECKAGALDQLWTFKDHLLSIQLSESEPLRYVMLRENPLPAIASAVPKEKATQITFVPLHLCNWPSRWIMRPSECKVNGVLIEELDPLFNYRRGVEMGHIWYGEDKTHLLPWLLASKADLRQRRRKVLLDFGGATFDTSTQWFLQMYPLEFDEIHVFEVIKGLHVKPPAAEDHPIHLFRRAQLDKITLYEGKYVSTKDSANSINITRWMLEDIKLTPEDAVIVKMDIESEEWNILPLWMKEHKVIADIVDELFVEVHFGHPSMIRWDWDKMFASKGRRDALQLLMDLRAAGIYTHIWP